ncbi:curli production assembly protein CsgG [Geovibrio thiophilus]|uniref:Curli production assembly protein CsgG n=1 Tax=Geovibrio thiophilus TaxID=139438 RepID=A0A3R5X3I4_9BACT|nr:CsgG/HfaB family protein [Geovibrio thiophilus]QAR33684.1 curli production assembly protein CsgG [Geovibrio thiophilus]
MSKLNILLMFLMLFLLGCTTTPTVIKIDVPTVVQPQVIGKEQHILKRKVAIARFGNEAMYSKSALFGLNNDYNAEKQATDILSAKLTQSGKFILLERSDDELLKKEIDAHRLESLKINADYLIVGSVSEFGRKTVSETGVFSRSIQQVAYAKVSVRLIDVKTGIIIFAQEGSGEALSEAGSAFGVGKHVGYDSTLNDKAISAAINSVVDGLMNNLLNKPWRSYILTFDESTITIAGGQNQGIIVGEIFNVYEKGKKIKNPQTGTLIELPGTKLGKIKVVQLFGSNYTDEGSVCIIEEGNFSKLNLEDLYVEK